MERRRTGGAPAASDGRSGPRGASCPPPADHLRIVVARFVSTVAGVLKARLWKCAAAPWSAGSFGTGWAYYATNITVTLVLALAANTSSAGCRC